ncbi:MAG: sugar transferase [candidate division Zixibacteria bacterium]|nr:sugar transferase [candidate division Zixibacteria bacterium]
MTKRAFDLGVALFGLLLAGPILLLVALAIKLSGPGPILFRQDRVGRNFQPFRICKFRTMASEALPYPLITVKGDPRVTRIGRFLRRTKLDEIPQLFNVIKGDMSLVGPRPEVPVYVEIFHSDYEEILQVRPGITDEASIVFRHESQLLVEAAGADTKYRSEILPQKIDLAKKYVQNVSFWGDVLILMRTIARL